MGRISPAEAYAKMKDEGFTYVDVRTPEEFEEGHPEGARNVPIDESFVVEMAKAFPRDAKIIVGCKAGGRSARAARELETAGFTNVLDQRAGWDGVRGSFGEIVEPGWSRCDLPKSP
ncbi:MAG: rhodanese-like domain-containing protein [Deltaproteobacteria bacterium]|nr:rhodanese-like domain-containing protein [Deltaproteobacteria bacterium]